MNYIKECELELKNYNDLILAVSNLKEELQYIEEELTGIKSSNLEDVPGGGSVNPDDRVCNLLFRKQVKEKAYIETEQELKRIDNKLKLLQEDGILLKKWYIDSEPMWKLQNEFNVSERQLYRMKSGAIRRMAVQLFGIKALA